MSIESSCGGVVRLSDSNSNISISTPFFHQYSTSIYTLGCTWFISCPQNRTMKLLFVAIDIINSQLSVGNFMYIDGDFNVSMLPVISANDAFELRYEDNAHQNSTRGLKVHVTLEVERENEALPNEPSCGGVVGLSDRKLEVSLSTLFYNQYTNHYSYMTCSWYISGSKNKLLHFLFLDINITNSYLNIERFMGIDGDFNLSMVQLLIPTTYSPYLTYNDKSHGSYSRGFHLEIRMKAEESGHGESSNESFCGRVLQLSDGNTNATISWSFYNQRDQFSTSYPYMYCAWYISGSPNKVIHFLFLDINITASSLDLGSFMRFDGDLSVSMVQLLAQSHANDPLYLHFGTHYYYGSHASGFRLEISMEDDDDGFKLLPFDSSCGGMIPLSESYSNTTISTPIYHRYSTNNQMMCAWTIVGSPDKVITLTFLEIDIVNSHLSIRNIMYIDGTVNTTLPTISSGPGGLELTYSYYSGDHHARGFYVNVTLKDSVADVVNSTPSCGGTIRLSKSYPRAAVATPFCFRAPYSYGDYHTMDCYWTLQTPPGARAVLTWQELVLTYSTLDVEPYVTHLHGEFNGKLSPTILPSSRMFYISYHENDGEGRQPCFHIEVGLTEIFPNFTASCGGMVPLSYSSANALLSTILYHQDIHANLIMECTWFISCPPGMEVQLTVLGLKLSAADVRIYDHPSSENEAYLISRLADNTGVGTTATSSRGGLTMTYHEYSFDNKGMFVEVHMLAKSFEVTMRILEVYGMEAVLIPELDDPDSSDFKKLSKEICYPLYNVFAEDGFHCRVLNFMAGSIMANYTLTFPHDSAENTSSINAKISLELNKVDGAFSGNYTFDTSVLVVQPLDECSNRLHDCSSVAECIDLGEHGFTCQCRNGSSDKHPSYPGRFCDTLPYKAFDVTMTLAVINGTKAMYTESLGDTESMEFQELEYHVCEPMVQTFTPTSADFKCKVTEFINGSIIVNYALIFPGSTNETLDTVAGTLSAELNETDGAFDGSYSFDEASLIVEALNECTEGLADCSTNANCTDLGENGYTCNCLAGFEDQAPEVPGRYCAFITIPSKEVMTTYPNRMTTNTPKPVDKAIDDLGEVPITDDNVEEVSKELASLTNNSDNITSEGVESTTDILQNITSLNSTEPEVTDSVVKTVSNLMDVPEGELATAAAEDGSTNKAVQSLETQLQFVNVSGDNGTYKEVEDNIGVQVTEYPPDTNVSLTFIYATNYPDMPLEEKDIVIYDRVEDEDPDIQSAIHATISLPTRIIKTNNFRVSFIIYRTTALFPSKSLNEFNKNETTFDRKVNTRIISASIDGHTITSNVTVNTSYTLLSTENDTTKRPVCVYWDYEADEGYGNWSSNGCWLLNENDNMLTCQCDHLTNFAVLMDIYGNSGHSSPQEKILEVLSYIGCSLSIVCLLVTILTYLKTKELRSQPGRILMCLSASLMLLYATFIVFMSLQGNSETACAVLTGIVHYALLSALCWMAVESFNMYRMVIKVFDGGGIDNFMAKAAAFAFGAPAVAVGITGGITRSEYVHGPESGEMCGFLQKWPVIGGILIPMAIIVLYGTCVFGMVLKRLSEPVPGKIETKTRYGENIRRMQNAVALIVLMGLTWIMGFFTSISDSNNAENVDFAFDVIFVVLNSLQGVFIFLFYCVRNQHARNQWRRQLHRCLHTKILTTSNDGTSQSPSQTKMQTSSQTKSRSAEESGSESEDVLNNGTSKYVELMDDRYADERNIPRYKVQADSLIARSLALASPSELRNMRIKYALDDGMIGKGIRNQIFKRDVDQISSASSDSDADQETSLWENIHDVFTIFPRPNIKFN